MLFRSCTATSFLSLGEKKVAWNIAFDRDNADEVAVAGAVEEAIDSDSEGEAAREDSSPLLPVLRG